MRHFKQIASAVTALALTAALTLPLTASLTASAATITVKSDTSDSASTYVSNFSAYKILNVTVGTKEVEGDAGTESSTTKKVYKYEVNTKYKAILAAVTEETEDDKIVEYLSNLADSDALRPVADKIYKAILAHNAAPENAANQITPDKTSTNGVIDIGEDNGYYLVAETKSTDGSYSLVMVDTADGDDIVITPKKDKPVFDKEIKDVNATGNETAADRNGVWRDSADHNIGEQVDFRMKATLPDNLASYTNGYKMVFHDSFRDANGKEVFDLSKLVIDSVWIDVDGDGVYNEAIDKKIESTGVLHYTYVKATTANDTFDGDTQDFQITVYDLTKSGVEFDFDTYNPMVVIDYHAELSADAVIGKEGNWNDAYLSYSNNPYWEKSGYKDEDEHEEDDTNGEEDKDHETEDTAVDSVVTFTYTVIVDKKDQDKKPLTGAEFTLYKWVPGEQGAAGSWETVGTPLTADSAGTQFTLKGLDAGKYKLVETHVPDGYTKGDDIEFVIEATHSDNGASSELTGFVVKDANGNVIDQTRNDNLEAVFTSNKDAGSASTVVINTEGEKLPSTGGIGTVLFYVIGGMIVAGAGVTLITRKRMEEE